MNRASVTDTFLSYSYDIKHSFILQLVCPVCREQIETPTYTAPPAETDSFVFHPDPVLLQQQAVWRQLYDEQKRKGGIIDLEWEKNKYLLATVSTGRYRLRSKLRSLKYECRVRWWTGFDAKFGLHFMFFVTLNRNPPIEYGPCNTR